jgi:hypothetical protein
VSVELCGVERPALPRLEMDQAAMNGAGSEVFEAGVPMVSPSTPPGAQVSPLRPGKRQSPSGMQPTHRSSRPSVFDRPLRLIGDQPGHPALGAPLFFAPGRLRKKSLEIQILNAL